MGHGVGAHQAQARGVGVASGGALVLCGGGVDGGDVGAAGGKVGGVPAEPTAEVEDAQSGHVAEDLGAGAGAGDAPVPPVQLGQLESSRELVVPVGVPGRDGVLFDGHRSSIRLRAGSGAQGVAAQDVKVGGVDGGPACGEKFGLGRGDAEVLQGVGGAAAAGDLGDDPEGSPGARR